MGRPKRLYPLGKYRLRTPKESDKNEAYPIELEYTWNRQIIRKTTNVFVNFDKSKEYTLNYYYSYNRKTMTKDTGYRVKVGDSNQAGNNGKGVVRPSYGCDYARVNNRLDDFLREIDERLRGYNEILLSAKIFGKLFAYLQKSHELCLQVANDKIIELKD